MAQEVTENILCGWEAMIIGVGTVQIMCFNQY